MKIILVVIVAVVMCASASASTIRFRHLIGPVAIEQQIMGVNSLCFAWFAPKDRIVLTCTPVVVHKGA